MKPAIRVQSISDIITNSSSEVFCRITSDDMESVSELLRELFPDYAYADDCPKLRDLSEEEDGETGLVLEMPYSLYDVSLFFKAGLEAILDSKFKGNYNIEYYDN